MIYFLEDDNSIRELVLYTLNNSGLSAQGFSKPSEFWAAMSHTMPKLLLLDIMLPEEDGLSILRKLRSAASTRKLPIMMLTAKGTEYDAVLGLDSGADDYVQKPFRMMELLSRVRALLRRTDPDHESADYLLGELWVSPSKHLVQVGGEGVTLTLKEFELLCLLLDHMDIVLTRDQLLDRVWGGAMARESRTVDVHIRTLRQKLGTAGRYIETIRGIGYKIDSHL
jgi:two-component system alkaline phosphatase synthesis response regulator PhoP